MGQYAKGIVAVITAVLVSISTLVAADTTAGKVITIALALVGAISVYLVPNTVSKRPVV